MATEGPDVLWPASQRRDAQDESRESKVQIGPEGSFLPKVAMGRANHSDVHAHRFLRSDSPNLTVLQHPQKARLEVQGKLPDFIEKQRTSCRKFKHTSSAVHRAGERPSFVTKELALDQVPGHASGIDRNERSPLPRAPLVKRAGDIFLTGTALPENKRRPLHRGIAVHFGEHRQHSGGNRDKTRLT